MEVVREVKFDLKGWEREGVAGTFGEPLHRNMHFFFQKGKSNFTTFLPRRLAGVCLTYFFSECFLHGKSAPIWSIHVVWLNLEY